MPKKSADENILVNAAKVIGKAVGKAATLAGAATESESGQPPAKPQRSMRTDRVAKGKLQKKNKPRLPRRLKKARKKMQTGS